MFRIVAEGQGWLDSFNDRYGSDYSQGDIVSENEILVSNEFVEYRLVDEIDIFNHMVAQGEAIWLEKVEK